MQQLQAKFKNIPTDASQVCSSISSALNRDQSLSEQSIVLTCNNLDVNQVQQQTGRSLKAYVFVLSKQGKPLMPCSYAKSKKMVKEGAAHVVKIFPFTIQLNFECENKVQNITFGIDAGYKTIGFSAVSYKKELASGELILDSKTSERLTERKVYRRGRRNKLWYREPRFNNRTKKEGWLPPSTQRKYDTHINLLNRFKVILPITKVIVETATFDIQKINNPDIQGIGYQQGSMYGYQNTRAYLMAREQGLCQVCHKKFDKTSPSHIHHCKQRSEAGSNKPSNLAILHRKCHEKLHAKGLKLSAPKAMKAETFMSIINNRFLKDIPDVEITYGYKTFVDRNTLGLEKTHYNDAFVIANGNKQIRTIPITIKQKHRNSRFLQLNRKCFAPAIRKQRYPIQPKDLVWINGKRYSVSGTHCKGKSIILEETKKSISVKKVKKVYHFGSLIFN